jgi:hypothetical protein
VRFAEPGAVKLIGGADTLQLPDLSREEVEEIERVGKTVHYRYYTEHMERDFPLPDLPRKPSDRVPHSGK